MEELRQQWKENRKKEKRLLKRRMERKENFINQKVADKVPETLEGTLNTAFAKAFQLVFEKGTQYVEKTYQKDQLVKNYKDMDWDQGNPYGRFAVKAEDNRAIHTILSGAAGAGMGALGVGIPDIPLFIGMMLRGIYQLALNYGYGYESKEEKIWILMVIKGGLSYGEDLAKVNRQLNLWIQRKEEKVPLLEEQMEETAMALSHELLYAKFLQGFPLVGAVGGFYDAIYMNQVMEYAQLKYELRFLYEKKEPV